MRNHLSLDDDVLEEVRTYAKSRDVAYRQGLYPDLIRRDCTHLLQTRVVNGFFTLSSYRLAHHGEALRTSKKSRMNWSESRFLAGRQCLYRHGLAHHSAHEKVPECFRATHARGGQHARSLRLASSAFSRIPRSLERAHSGPCSRPATSNLGILRTVLADEIKLTMHLKRFVHDWRANQTGGRCLFAGTGHTQKCKLATLDRACYAAARKHPRPRLH